MHFNKSLNINVGVPHQKQAYLTTKITYFNHLLNHIQSCFYLIYSHWIVFQQYQDYLFICHLYFTIVVCLFLNAESNICNPNSGSTQFLNTIFYSCSVFYSCYHQFPSIQFSKRLYQIPFFRFAFFYLKVDTFLGQLDFHS